MAIDTRDKRFSMVGLALPARQHPGDGVDQALDVCALTVDIRKGNELECLLALFVDRCVAGHEVRLPSGLGKPSM